MLDEEMPFLWIKRRRKNRGIIQSGEILSIKHFRQRNTVKSAAYAVKFNFNESHIKTIEYYVA